MAQLLIVEDHTFRPTDPAKAETWQPTTLHAAMFGPGLLCDRARQTVEIWESGSVRHVAPVLVWRHGAEHDVNCRDCRDWRSPTLGGIQHAQQPNGWAAA